MRMYTMRRTLYGAGQVGPGRCYAAKLFHVYGAAMYITVNGQKLFFDVVGSKLAAEGPRMREKPTLLVLHGGPGFDHSGLRGDFDGFADIAQVVYLDHRGNGRSVPSDTVSWTLAQWGDD